MADRSAAAAFGQAFVTLAAQKKTPKRDQAARDLWKVAGRYDFTPGQMEAYHALAKLGLIDVEDEFEGKGLPKTPDYTKSSDRWAEKLLALLKKRVAEDTGPGFEMANEGDKRDAREIARIAGLPIPAWTKETLVPTRSGVATTLGNAAATLSQRFAKPSPADGDQWPELPSWAVPAAIAGVVGILIGRAIR